jgi:hypothetical protein
MNIVRNAGMDRVIDLVTPTFSLLAFGDRVRSL